MQRPLMLHGQFLLPPKYIWYPAQYSLSTLVELSGTTVKACLGVLANSDIKMGCYDKTYMLMNIHKPEAQGNLCDE